MQKLKKHAVWLIVVAIIVGILLMFKSRKAVAEPSPQDITVEGSATIAVVPLKIAANRAISGLNIAPFNFT